MNIKQNKVPLLCVVLVAFMLGGAYAMVPLYSLFCRMTGYGGTPKIASNEKKPLTGKETGSKHARILTLQFDANVAPGFSWSFAPTLGKLSVKVGEQYKMTYKATNISKRTLVGQATYNVSPDKVGAYFNKIQCFCFTEQKLEPGQSVELPVVFFIDPQIVEDKDLEKVSVVTLSYTFYEKKEGEDLRKSSVK